VTLCIWEAQCYFNSMCVSHAFLIALIRKYVLYTSCVLDCALRFLIMFLLLIKNRKKKKICASHMLKGHMLLLYVDCRKFSTNWFVENFCPECLWILLICTLTFVHVSLSQHTHTHTHTHTLIDCYCAIFHSSGFFASIEVWDLNISEKVQQVGGRRVWSAY